MKERTAPTFDLPDGGLTRRGVSRGFWTRTHRFFPGFDSSLQLSPLGGAASPAVHRAIRLSIVAALDFLVMAATLAFVVRFTNGSLTEEDGLPITLFACVATGMLVMLGLYGRSWRFTRFIDCLSLCRSVGLALVPAWAVLAVMVPTDHWGEPLLAVALLHAPAVLTGMSALRAARRVLRERRNFRGRVSRSGGHPSRRVIILGSPEWACTAIEFFRSDQGSTTEVVGILLIEDADTIRSLCGVPVLGGPGMLASAVAILNDRDEAPIALIISDRDRWPDLLLKTRVIERAKKLDLEVGRVTDSWNQLIDFNPGMALEKLSTAQLLGRPEYSMENQLVGACIQGRRILVTGAGGTIGGELARQLASFAPAELTLLDHSEHDLYRIDMELRKTFPALKVRQALCSIREYGPLRDAFKQAEPELVFHAAALKHVPIVEENPCAGAHTNVLGTRNVADLACEFSVRAMVQVSTDKAVNPVGMMGATKRIGEIYCQALDLCGVDDRDAPRFITVRFGNVLGSSGSIVPLFKQQIAEGRELTVTHPDITRYFMTVGEAVQLILQSSAHALAKETERGNIYVLDMGEPVKIYDLAQQMIRLSGLVPDVDIGIRFVGLRPGEKLFEELFDSCEVQVKSEIPGIFEARSRPLPLPLINEALARVERLVRDGDGEEIRRVLHNLVRIPAGLGSPDMPFGDFGTLMAEYARGNFTVVKAAAAVAN